MKESNNYQFNLPENLDIFDVEHFNENTEKTDTMFKSLNDGLNSTNSDLTSTKEDLKATKEDLRNTKENLSTTNQNLATARTELQTAINASGHSLSLSLNSSTYVMTLKLLDANSKVLDTKTIDFPIESLVMNGSYANGVLTLVLQSGQSINIDVSDLISGLATENDVAKKNDKITISDESALISDSDTFLQASTGTNPTAIVRKTFAMAWTWIRSKFTGKIIINLASSASATNDPSINITPGVSGTLPIANGGTGVESLEALRNALGLGNTLDVLPVANGGTGVESLEALRNSLGLGNTLSTLPVANGGTGVASLEALRNALGLGSTLDVLAVANGGTGQNSLDDLPIENSQKLVKSGGIYSAINNAIENAKDSINGEFSESLAKKNDKITISDNSTAISDSDTFLQASTGTNPTAIVRKTFAMVWTWIRSKFTGTIKIDLSSTSAATNNPSINITPGVFGTLPIANGGTGQNSLDDLPVENSQKLVRSGGIYSAIENAKNSISGFATEENLAKKNDKITISDNSTLISDSDTFLQASTGTNPTAIVRKTFAMVWTWIKSKFTGTIKIDLSSTSAATNNPSTNITPGVSGILPIANGGTGVNDLETLKSLFGLSELEDVLVSGLCYTTPRWLIFDFSKSSHKALKIKKGTKIRLDVNSESRWFKATEDVSLDLSTMMTTAANANPTRRGAINGRDFYLYLVPSGTSGVEIVVSCNSTFPNDIDSSYTASNTRKIGQFHTLCAAAGNYTTNGLYCKVACVSGGETVEGSYLVKKYKDDTDGFATFYTKEIKEVSTGYFYGWVKTVHPLEGFAAGDILPESVWCLSFKPHCLTPDGMVYDVETDKAVDIYLQSGKGKGTVSLYQGTTTNTRPQVCHEDDMRQVGKRLPTTAEFSSFALGSNEGTNITGTINKVKTGGWTDTAGRRMISAIGCEDCCGFLWQWLSDVAPLGYGAALGNTNAVQSNGFTEGYVGGEVSITVTGLGTAATGKLSNPRWCTIDGQDDFGQMHCILCGLVAGGNWDNAWHCGSRYRDLGNAVSRARLYIGARGMSHVLREA